MLEYSFLTLSLILALPGVLVWLVRADLRTPMHRVMLASLPFALTERLFYPDYWKPRFLFDLVNVIGFGIEDVLFVAGLAAFTTTAWPLVSRQTYEGQEPGIVKRVALFFAVGVALVAAVELAGVEMIYGAPALMTLFTIAVIGFRRDLWRAALGGGAVTTVVYTAICLGLMALIPDVFRLDWNTEEFLNVFVLGVPVEEMIYAAASGMSAAVFYPWVTGARLKAVDGRRRTKSSETVG